MKAFIYFLFIFCFSSVYSQNIKRIYKAIKNNELEDAVGESSKTDSKTKFDENENILFNLSQCVLQSNPNSSVFKPYEASNLFKSISISKVDETNEYLNKYDLNLNKIQEFIYAGVVFAAKKENTESSYTKALEVCKTCIYGNQLLELKISSAFVEAKNKMTISSFNDFINKYSKSKYADIAIDLRDSLAYLNTPKDYSSLNKYILDYPKSKMNQKIQNELPKLLYVEAVKSNDFEKYELFIQLYPNDLNIDAIKKRYEEINYNEISINEVNGWGKDICVNTDFSYDIEFIKVELNGKFGLINMKGKSTEIIYDKIEKINSTLAFVEKDKKFGIIEIQSGKIILPIQFNMLFYYLDDYIKAVKDDKYGIYFKNGEIVVPIMYEYSRIYSLEETQLLNISNSYSRVNKFFFNDDLAPTLLNNKYGYIDKKNKVVIPHKYNFAYDFKDGLAIVSKGDVIQLNYAEEENKNHLTYGIINKKEQVIIPFEFTRFKNLEKCIVGFKDTLSKVFDNKGNFLYSNSDEGKIKLAKLIFNTKYSYLIDDWRLLKSKYDVVAEYVLPFGKGFLPVGRKDILKEVLLDSNLIETIVFENEGLVFGRKKNIQTNIFPVMNKKKIGFINGNGTLEIPYKYDGIDFINDSMFLILLNKKYGILNKNGIELTPIKYDWISCFNEGFAFVEINGKCGIIDSTGKEITPFKYDRIDNCFFSEGFALVKLNNKYAFIDRKGVEVTQFEFDDGFPFENNTAFVKKNGKDLLIDKEFKIISEVYIPKWNWENKHLKFTCTQSKNKHNIELNNNLFKVEESNKIGYIDKRTGKQIIPIEYDSFDINRKIGFARVGCELKLFRFK